MLRCNPTVAQAANRVEAARGRCVQVGLYPNPVAGYIGAEIGNEGQGGQQGSFVGQEIVTAGKLRLNRSVAEQEVRQAEWAWQAQRRRVLTDVRRSFYDVLVAQRTMELTEQLLHIGEEGVRSTESLMKAKEVARAAIPPHALNAASIKESARNRRARPVTKYNDLRPGCNRVPQVASRCGRRNYVKPSSLSRPRRCHFKSRASADSATRPRRLL